MMMMNRASSYNNKCFSSSTCSSSQFAALFFTLVLVVSCWSLSPNSSSSFLVSWSKKRASTVLYDGDVGEAPAPSPTAFPSEAFVPYGSPRVINNEASPSSYHHVRNYTN